MKIIDSIKKSCKEKGVSEIHAERIQKAFKVEKEEDVASSVDTFKENILPSITEAEEVAKKTAKELAVAEYEKAHGLKDGKPVKSEEKPVEITGLSPELKAIFDDQSKQIADLTNVVTASAKQIAISEKINAAKKLIADAKLPEGWAGRIQVDSETSIEDQVKKLGEEYTQIQQEVINRAVESGQYSVGNHHVVDHSVEDWAKLMDSDAKPNNPGVVDLGI